jgi:hypothetical protein
MGRGFLMRKAEQARQQRQRNGLGEYQHNGGAHYAASLVLARGADVMRSAHSSASAQR